MTASPGIQTLLARLRLPPQDLETLTFCDGDKPAKVEAWANSLPLTRMSYVSGLLYQALPEISQLKTSPRNRLQMLDSLRPATQQCLEGLSRNYLNQPLILPDPALKTATVAQALQKHLTNGYMMAVHDLCTNRQRDKIAAQEQQALAIHRALSSLSQLVLRSYQLYTPTPGQFWEQIHSLFLLAETLGVQHHPVRDTLVQQQPLDTAEKIYLRLLLLGCARANQLNQEEVSCTYAALSQLAPLARLLPHDPARRETLFAVMLDGDQPPRYKSRLPEPAKGVTRDLDTSGLVDALQMDVVANAVYNSARRNGHGLTTALSQHLINAWKNPAERAFERHQAHHPVELIIGLSGLHFHLSNGITFDQFLNETQEANAADESLYPTYIISALDVSPGGYCLEWRSQIPAQVKAGEILGIRDEGRSKWGIGVVRWVQRTHGATQLGIQILAPTARPIGTAIMYEAGGYSDYLRALWIPAIKGSDQPETLITNTVSFHERSNVRIYQTDGAYPVELTRRIFSTGSVSQFTFRKHSLGAAASKGKDSEPEDFDSLWK